MFLENNVYYPRENTDYHGQCPAQYVALTKITDILVWKSGEANWSRALRIRHGNVSSERRILSKLHCGNFPQKLETLRHLQRIENVNNNNAIEEEVQCVASCDFYTDLGYDLSRKALLLI